MSRRGRLGALAICPLVLPLAGCAGSAAGADQVDFASRAVPSVAEPPSAAAASTAAAPDESQAVLDAYAEYVAESDRFFDESIAAAAEAGVYAGSPELDAILDAVAIGRIREFDAQTPMVLWNEGGVATTGAPVVVSAKVVAMDIAAGTAELKTCTDFTTVDYLNADGGPLKPTDVPEFLLETVSLQHQGNPRNSDVIRWYVSDRVSEQVSICE